MFLKRLIIDNQGEIVRDIRFRKGINLIVDTTNPEDRKESGNNVGKTTVLRLIDFCLGSRNGKNIYEDPEFAHIGTNTDVEEFLKDNVVVSLVLKDNLDDEDSREITIRRNFSSHSKPLREIDGEQYKEAEFLRELSRLIFATEQEKPTFRNLISKNIRYEKNRLLNTVKILHSTTKAVEYEALFFFWLGVEIPSAQKKQKLDAELKKEDGFSKRLGGEEGGLEKIEQVLGVLRRDIEELEREKKQFSINANYEEDLKRFNALREEINRLTTRVSRIETRKALVLESIAELEKEKSEIDTERIRALYEEAKTLIPNMQKTFEDTLAFHNQMLDEKRKFIRKELPDIEQQLEECNQQLVKLNSVERDLARKLHKIDAIKSLEEVMEKLNRNHESKGQYEERKKQLEDSESKINFYKSELEKINASIDSQTKLMGERITEFNRYFSYISRELYDEAFILSHQKGEKAYTLNVSKIGGNPGTGKKRGEIVAFDLAYIQFADAMNIKCPHFVLHDQIEAVHDNQISTILTRVVKQINCQLIWPVLKDKLPREIDTEQYEILRLSQSEKLFRV